MVKIKSLDEIELLGIYELQTYGFKDGSVSDLAELSECIHKTLTELSQKSGVKIKEVFIGVDANLVTARETHTVVPLIDRGTKVITYRDIKKINDQVRLLGTQMEEEVIDDLPQHYVVDETNYAHNPIGLLGRKLGITSLILSVDSNRVQNIYRAVTEAGFEVAHMFYNTLSAAQVCLTDEEINDGCILLDIGAKITSILIYKEGVLRFVDKIPLGGDNFTKNIAEELNLTFDLAEDIKKSYAFAQGGDQEQEEEILVKKEDEYIPIKRLRIFQAIEPCIEELVQSVYDKIKSSQLSDQVNGGMTIIGGGALLPGLMECIEEVSGFDVKLGKINNLSLKNFNNASLFVSVIGLAAHGYKKSLKMSHPNGKNDGLFSRFTGRFKELYQEYF